MEVVRNILNSATLACLGMLVAPLVHAAPGDSGEIPDLSGVWKPTHVSLDDPRWRIEDLACAGMCSLGQFEHLQSLLRNPDNDDVSVKALYSRSIQYNLEHSQGLLTPAGRRRVEDYELEKGAALDCSPDGDGWSTQLFAPLPTEIRQFADRVEIRYEYWNAIRTIYLDDRKQGDEAPSRLGWSKGTYLDGELVVETTNLLPGELYLPDGNDLVAIVLSEDAVGTERYSLSEDGERLDLVWAISDSRYLDRAVRGQKSVLRAPGWELEEFICEAMTGEF